MDQILIYAAVLSPFVAGFVEIVKRKAQLQGKEVLVLAVLIGIVIGGLYGATIAGDIVGHIWGGAASGMMAIGVFEVVKKEEKPYKGDQEFYDSKEE